MLLVQHSNDELMANGTFRLMNGHCSMNALSGLPGSYHGDKDRVVGVKRSVKTLTGFFWVENF
jgi:hypothetical protein